MQAEQAKVSGDARPKRVTDRVFRNVRIFVLVGVIVSHASFRTGDQQGLVEWLISVLFILSGIEVGLVVVNADSQRTYPLNYALFLIRKITPVVTTILFLYPLYYFLPDNPVAEPTAKQPFWNLWFVTPRQEATPLQFQNNRSLWFICHLLLFYIIGFPIATAINRFDRFMLTLAVLAAAEAVNYVMWLVYIPATFDAAKVSLSPMTHWDPFICGLCVALASSQSRNHEGLLLRLPNFIMSFVDIACDLMWITSAVGSYQCLQLGLSPIDTKYSTSLTTWWLMFRSCVMPRFTDDRSGDITGYIIEPILASSYITKIAPTTFWLAVVITELNLCRHVHFEMQAFLVIGFVAGMVDRGITNNIEKLSRGLQLLLDQFAVKAESVSSGWLPRWSYSPPGPDTVEETP